MLGIMLAFLVGYVFRVIAGPSVWDRLLGMNLVATKIILIIMIFASIYNSTFLLDFAIIYALSGFLGTTFLILFLSERNNRKLKLEGKSLNVDITSQQVEKVEEITVSNTASPNIQKEPTSSC